eukprot:518126-Pyramimonas_sp.AAC.1
MDFLEQSGGRSPSMTSAAAPSITAEFESNIAPVRPYLEVGAFRKAAFVAMICCAMLCYAMRCCA